MCWGSTFGHINSREKIPVMANLFSETNDTLAAIYAASTKIKNSANACNFFRQAGEWQAEPLDVQHESEARSRGHRWQHPWLGRQIHDSCHHSHALPLLPRRRWLFWAPLSPATTTTPAGGHLLRKVPGISRVLLALCHRALWKMLLWAAMMYSPHPKKRQAPPTFPPRTKHLSSRIRRGGGSQGNMWWSVGGQPRN